MLSQDTAHQTPTASESDDQSPTDDQTATPTDDQTATATDDQSPTDDQTATPTDDQTATPTDDQSPTATDNQTATPTEDQSPTESDNQRSTGPWRYRKCKIQSRQRLILNIRERKRNLDIKQVLSELGQLLPTKPNERLMDRTRLCLLKSAYKFIYRLSDFARFCDFTCRTGNTLQTLTASGGQSAPSGAPLNSLIKAYCSQFKPATFSHQYSHVLPPANHNHALQQYHAQVPPHHAQVPPHHAQVPPHHAQVPPHHAQIPPHHAQVPPHHGQVPPHHGQVPPHHAQVPPHHAQVPPHHAQVPPHHAQVPPHHAQVPPHHAQVPPHHAQVSPHHAQVSPHHAQEAVPIPPPSENFKFQETNAYGQDGNCQHQTPAQHYWIHASSSAVAPSRHANPCDVMSAQPCDVISALPYDVYSIRSNDDMATLPRHVPDEPYFSPPQHQVPHVHGQWAAGGQWATDGQWARDGQWTRDGQTFCAIPVCFPRPPDVQKFPFSHGDSSNRLYPVIYHGPHPPVLSPGVMHHPPPTTLQCRSMGIMPATCCPIMFDASHAQMVGHH
ncbi:uncharacterized protein LOC131957824 [Physella acuta]|uniref:uncharacterized protein LOC131957824 n=1 Tax=Physella acuta TaxID=109671 RepID=UPI0027DC413E|nr:uncharacterized protein LOC131957824 [Physella acuta]